MWDKALLLLVWLAVFVVAVVVLLLLIVALFMAFCVVVSMGGLFECLNTFERRLRPIELQKDPEAPARIAPSSHVAK